MVIATANGDHSNTRVGVSDLYAFGLNVICFQVAFEKLAEFIRTDSADHIRFAVKLCNSDCLVSTFTAVCGHKISAMNGLAKFGQDICVNHKVDIDTTDNQNIFHNL